MIYFLADYNQHHYWLIAIFAVYDTAMLILQATPWNKRSFLIWVFFIWPLFADLPTTIFSISYIKQQISLTHVDNDEFAIYTWVAFFSMIGVVPWLRVVNIWRFYVTVVLQTVLRTIPCFVLMFIFCFIWSVKIEFSSQVAPETFQKTIF